MAITHPDIFKDVAEFSRIGGSPSIKTHSRFDVINLCKKLIEEEVVKELLPQMEDYSISGSLEHLALVVDSAIDSIYVCAFLLTQMKVDADDHWKAVQERNMAKFPNGIAVKNEYGKIQKPEGWFPPDQAHMQLLVEWNSKMRGEFYQGGLIQHMKEEQPDGTFISIEPPVANS